MGKGDRPRPVDKKKYDENYKRIFGKCVSGALNCPKCGGVHPIRVSPGLEMADGRKQITNCLGCKKECTKCCECGKPDCRTWCIDWDEVHNQRTNPLCMRNVRPRQGV